MTWWHLFWLFPLALVTVLIVASVKKRREEHEGEGEKTKTKKSGHDAPDDHGHDAKKKSGGGGCMTFASAVLVLGIAWTLFGLGSALIGVRDWMKKPRVYSAPASSVAPSASTDPEWPSTGSAFLEKGGEAKAWLDPSSLHTMGSKPVDYTLEGHPSMTFHDDFTGRHDRKFRHFPAGRYIVTTDATEEVYFEWRPAH